MVIPHLYEKNVFINCPFDEEYTSLFEAIIFTIYILEFILRSSFEIDDGGVRVEKIIKLISECKYGIHDISRTELNPENHLPRFNMPFELGIDIGCKYLSENHHCEKVHLIIDTENHRFRIYLSDISGQDVKAHKNDPNEIIKVVRNWLSTSLKKKVIPSASFIQKQYELFRSQMKRICDSSNLDAEDLQYTDFCHIIEIWLLEMKRASSG